MIIVGVFKVLSLKGFDETYRLEVSSTSHLVQNSTAENIYLIEHVLHQAPGEASVCQVEVSDPILLSLSI